MNCEGIFLLLQIVYNNKDIFFYHSRMQFVYKLVRFNLDWRVLNDRIVLLLAVKKD